MPIAVLEPLSSLTDHGPEAHDLYVKVAGDRDWISKFKELKALMSKAGQSSGPSSSAAKPSKPSKDWKNKGTYVSTILPIKLHIATSVVLRTLPVLQRTTIFRPLFYDFSLLRHNHDREGGYRCKICTVPTPFLCLPDPLEKMRNSNSVPYLCMSLSLSGYVLSVKKIRIFLVMIFLRILLIFLHSI